ncbi:MAG: guanylate kinase [Lachnospiraceae bacterium]|nr:guanylate kinase [Lachnospiraceae bacterium]
MQKINNRGILTVVSGFAGSGKGTLMKKLLEDYDCYALSVSATSRSPRPGEEEGVSYFYKTRDEFEKMIENDELLEHAEYVGNYYGTPKEYVFSKLDEGFDVILEIEIQGAMQIREKYPDTLLVFVLPPSASELKNRLVGRGTETPEVIEKRMTRAAAESEGIEKYDYIVINDDIDECAKQLHEIIKAAHFTPSHQADFIADIRKELKERKN